ncbi:hypothetical protein KIW84_011102 [Lathyrus oleraceus]|uniref:Uncharacterized protein n=1 Tax=Pisum sativum TaxID=3888 RepID=A0A9D5BEI2_PEA|nr:hypothetical protein KIW84_011102 [Pisum sativum]
MDVVREEQVAFREEMDFVKSKIEQIFEAIQALARREEEACSGPSVPIPNPVIYGLPPGFIPPPERTHVPPPAHTSGVADGVAAQGPPIVNQVVIPHTDEELQDEFEMQNYNGATLVVIPTAAQDSEAILMCHITTQSFSNIVFSPAKFHELPSKSLGSSHSPKESSVSQEQLNMRLFPKGSILFISQQFASTKSS